MTLPHEPEFALWTDDVAMAQAATRAGVTMIGPDLEIIGKRERQPERESYISTHRPECLKPLGDVLPPERRFVRCNAPAVALGQELDALMSQGVRSIMLPMVRRTEEVRQALDQLQGRARLIVMIEHIDAFDRLDELLSLRAVHAFYIGVNDLSRSQGHRTRFGAIADGSLERIASELHRGGLRFGFLGLSNPALPAGTLPVCPALSMAAMIELGASLFLFARSYQAEPLSFATRFQETQRQLALIRAMQPALRSERCLEFKLQCAAAEAAAVAAFQPAATA